MTEKQKGRRVDIEKLANDIMREFGTGTSNRMYNRNYHEIDMYLRFGITYYDNKWVRCLTIANITIAERHRGQGVFTKLITLLKENCERFGITLVIECVVNERLHAHFTALGWRNHRDYSGFIWLPSNPEFVADAVKTRYWMNVQPVTIPDSLIDMLHARLRMLGHELGVYVLTAHEQGVLFSTSIDQQQCKYSDYNAEHEYIYLGMLRDKLYDVMSCAYKLGTQAVAHQVRSKNADILQASYLAWEWAVNWWLSEVPYLWFPTASAAQCLSDMLNNVGLQYVASPAKSTRKATLKEKRVFVAISSDAYLSYKPEENSDGQEIAQSSWRTAASPADSVKSDANI